MSFRECVREHAAALKAKYQGYIDDGTAGASQKSYVKNVDCTIDFFFATEPLWIEFLADLGFRDLQKKLRRFRLKVEAFLAYLNNTDLRVGELKLGIDSFKRFYEKFKALKKAHENCPPVKGLIGVMTLYQAFSSMAAAGEELQRAYDKLKGRDAIDKALFIAARNTARQILEGARGILNSDSDTAAKNMLPLIVPLVVFLSGPIAAASPEAAADSASEMAPGFVTMFVYMAAVADASDPDDPDDASESFQDRVDRSLELLRMIESCLAIGSGIRWDSPEVKKLLETAGEKGPDGQPTKRANEARIKLLEMGSANIPRPEKPKFLILPSF